VRRAGALKESAIPAGGTDVHEVSVTAHFSAAHRLSGYQGACSALHGHNWEIEVFVRGGRTNATGILLDFRQLKEAVARVIEPLDHADLNAVEALGGMNPTSENIARFLFGKLAATLDCADYRVARVSVRETPGSRASYWEE
jgi:6-pyruvoyltetrahydropterin/6-carboxytetrahydropterin synthase